MQTSWWYTNPMAKSRSGFTIVELLIVIVVIGILAAISIVAYNNVQKNARNSQRQQDIATIQKALEMYYTENGNYPPGNGDSLVGASWSNTANNSWANLETHLKPYINSLPKDPVSTPGASIFNGTVESYNYVYFADRHGAYCSTTPGQMYILAYRLEGQPVKHQLDPCSAGTNLGPYSAANTIRRVK